MGVQGEVHLPRSFEELWPLLRAEPETELMAGGTDLLVRVRTGRAKPSSIVCLERLAELKGVRDEGRYLWIGAGETHTSLLSAPLIRAHLPLLCASLSVLGSPLIRNAGTIGGNICTASPAGDSLPPLYVLGAELELSSESGARFLPIAEFILGPGRTALKMGEILKGIRVKKAGDLFWSFEKVGRRQALSIALVSLAALLRLAPGGLVQEAHLAWGSVGPTVMSSSEAEKALIGRPLVRSTLQEAAKRAMEAVQPIEDVLATALYRRTLAGNLLLRLETRR